MYNRAGAGGVKAGCLMHSFPLPGSPWQQSLPGAVSAGAVLPHAHARRPLAPSLPQGRWEGVPTTAGPSPGGCHGVVPAQRAQRCGQHHSAVQLQGAKLCACPCPWHLPQAAVMSPAEEAAFWAAGREEADRAGRAACAVRTWGCGGWSSCGPSRFQSQAAGPLRTPHCPPLSQHPLGSGGSRVKPWQLHLPYPPTHRPLTSLGGLRELGRVQAVSPRPFPTGG